MNICFPFYEYLSICYVSTLLSPVEYLLTLFPYICNMSNKNKTKMVGTTIREIVDHKTGEVIDTAVEKHFVTKIEKDKFFAIYIDKLRYFYGLSRGVDKDVLVKMCEIAEYNTGRVVISTGIRCDIMKDLKISSSNLSRSIKNLKTAGLVTGERGVYFLNPELFWKGSESTRQEVLRSEDGITFKLTFYGEKE